MNDHRPPQNPGLGSDKLNKVAQDLTTPAKSDDGLLCHARDAAYATVDWIKETAEHAPVGTAITAAGLAIGIYGAVRTALPERIAATVVEDGLAEGSGRALASAAENNTLAEGSQALNSVQRTMVHLTTSEGKVGIANTLKIGSRWGVYGLDSTQVPQNGLVRQVASLVPKELTAEIPIGPNASKYFQAPTPVGPFSLVRNLAGVKNTPLGSIDLARDTFIRNEIFTGGVFRPATSGEIAQYKIHQWLLDYSVDSLGTVMAGLFTSAYEYKRICDKNDNYMAKERPHGIPPHRPQKQP